MDDDDRMRALLAEAGGQQGPPMGISADGIARRGRRIRLARWGAAVTGGLAVAAVITVSVALAANRHVEPATPPVVVTTTVDTDTPTTTVSTSTTPPGS